MDKDGSAIILYYGSMECRRETRSFIAAELLALVNGYDEAFVVKKTLQDLMNCIIPLEAYVDSRTTFNCIA